ncbi:hypothetical protein [Streptomyces xiamenensis]|uniref:hypothetical protein n=1 Tax=Streptomyces xiamenensis TaxID=408015 RepID=UPI0035E2BE2D
MSQVAPPVDRLVSVLLAAAAIAALGAGARAVIDGPADNGHHGGHTQAGADEAGPDR